jgi:ribonuclease P protein component
VNPRFRLTRSADFQRVRRIGKSFPHPLIVLVAAPNDLETIRFAIVASRAVGSAVRRNRAKRLVRAALHEISAQIIPGWDVILIARRSLAESSFTEVKSAIDTLLRRARLLKDSHGN